MDSYSKKIVLLGEGAVGKTSLIRSFVYSKFDDEYITTIGTKVTKKDIHLPKKADINLQIWDVLGQQDYSRVQRRALQGAQGLILVLDLTRPDTFRAWKDYWVPECFAMTGIIPLVALGNKADLVDELKVERKELKQFSRDMRCPVYSTSAKTGDHVEEAFTAICELMIDGEQIPDIQARGDAVELFRKERKMKNLNIFIDVTDDIISDFCGHFGGGIDDGMPIIRAQFEKAGVDIRSPLEMNLIKAVHLLAGVEGGFLPCDQVRMNKLRRLRMVKRVKRDAGQGAGAVDYPQMI